MWNTQATAIFELWFYVIMFIFLSVYAVDLIFMFLD